MLIYFANLTHVVEGLASSEAIPLNIGCLASYLLKYHPNDIEVELFNLPSRVEQAFDRKVPDVFVSSAYAWNFYLNYTYLEHFKSLYPDMVTIMGGPNYPGLPELQNRFLRRFHAIDFFVYREGEITLLDIVSRLMEAECRIGSVKGSIIAGSQYIAGDRFYDGGSGKRLKIPDEVPSPYLSGMFDEFLEAGFAPLIQTNRGCPFTCAYCNSSSRYYSKVYKNSFARVKSELEYIARRAKSKLLHVADDNYGLFEQDIDISATLTNCRAIYNWPLKINLATAKINYERVLLCVISLQESLYFCASVQSLDEVTLAHIKRKNLSFDQHQNIFQNLQKSQVKSVTELILGLPAETKESHLKGIRTTIDAGIDMLVIYTCMVLANTPLKEDPYFDQFELVKKFRVIPRDFGTYLGRRVVEVEQVCVASNSLSLEEYFDLRGLHFVVTAYYNLGVFREMIAYLRIRKIDILDLLIAIQKSLFENSAAAGSIYRRFLDETRTELWDSEDALLEHYSYKKNFDKLLKEGAGANLLNKYQGLFLTEFNEFTDVLVKVTGSTRGIDKSVLENLALFSREVRGNIFSLNNKEKISAFGFDVMAWVEQGMNADPAQFTGLAKVKFFSTDEQVNILNDLVKTYGNTDSSKGKILSRINPDMLYRKYEKIEGKVSSWKKRNL